MSGLYMLQNKLKKQPQRDCTYIQNINPSIILHKITLKYGHFDVL